MGGYAHAMARLIALHELEPGRRFRFPEESRRQGFPYVVLDVSVTVKGSGFFAEGERPIALRRLDGRYPRYGSLQGFYPVRDADGRLVHWVAHPTTQVVVPSFGTRFLRGIAGLFGVILALLLLYAVLSALRYVG